jgi:mannitol/fructose-specific phosphotransferase system IIA component (Ntr-type)
MTIRSGSAADGDSSNEELLDHLVRYQELTFALLEQQAAGSQAGLKEIQSSLEETGRRLPREWLRIAQRLQGGGQPAVVPAAAGVCSFCRIQLPTLMFQEIRKLTRIHQCPCCGRILYMPTGGGLQSGSAPSRFGRGGVARFSSRKLMIPQLRAEGRDEVLEELIQTLSEQGWVSHPQEILRAAIAREELVSTAVDHGLAFPHVRGVEGGGLVIALGLHPTGLNFGTQDGGLTRIIFFSAIPQAAGAIYLRIMAGLVRVFREEPLRERLLACQDSQEIWDALVEITQDTLL